MILMQYHLLFRSSRSELWGKWVRNALSKIIFTRYGHNLRHVCTKRKGKRKFSLVFVAYSLNFLLSLSVNSSLKVVHTLSFCGLWTVFTLKFVNICLLATLHSLCFWTKLNLREDAFNYKFASNIEIHFKNWLIIKPENIVWQSLMSR